jgi:hypothetical protein
MAGRRWRRSSRSQWRVRSVPRGVSVARSYPGATTNRPPHQRHRSDIMLRFPLLLNSVPEMLEGCTGLVGLRPSFLGSRGTNQHFWH